MFGKLKKVVSQLTNSGATYADIRMHTVDKGEWISFLDGKFHNYHTSSSFGYGVRVLFNGAWGFASGEDEKQLEKIAMMALSNAKSSSAFIKRKITLSSKKVVQGEYSSPCKINPFQVSLKEKVETLARLEKKLAHSKFDHTNLNTFFHERQIYYVDSEGTETVRNLLDVKGNLSAMAKDRDGLSQERNLQLYFEGNGTRGFETITDPKFDQGERIRDELLQILDAPICDKEVCDVILLPEMMALQTHETIGHALELDRILGYELSYAGGSHVNLDSFGKLQFGSKKLTARADGTVPNSPGSVGFDDDGVAAHNEVLIENGILKSAISGRQSVAEANERAKREIFKNSAAASRATDYSKPSIDRMTNINVDAGNDGTLKDFISKTENGIILESPRSWSIGSNRENFHFATEWGQKVKNGKVVGVVRNPTYRGDSIKFWNSLEMVGDRSTWQLQQVFNCGKGQPNQVMRLGHGVPLTLFKNVEVGY